MTEIWFIRHGETAWNREGRLQGWQDIELNAAGRHQAERLAARICASTQIFDALYSSDLQRAYATAAPLSAGLGLRVHGVPGLRERCYGVLEGLDLARLDELAPEAAAARNSRDPDRPLEGGESLGQFRARVIAAVDDIAGRHPGQCILAVTHGGVLDIVWRHACGVALDAPRPVPLLNASITRVGIDGGRWQVLQWADVDHLDAESASDIVP